MILAPYESGPYSYCLKKHSGPNIFLVNLEDKLFGSAQIICDASDRWLLPFQSPFKDSPIELK